MNHFIEFNQSKNTGKYYFSIHTGSRNFGKTICMYHVKKAKGLLEHKRKIDLNDEIKELVKNTKDKTRINKLIDELKEKKGVKDAWYDLAYLEDDKMFDYLVDMIIAQKYARYNTNTIIRILLEILNTSINDIIISTHNYIDFDDMIIRKGAIKSYSAQRMIIPFNMRDGSLICAGKSNPEWNYSAPHGAGRIMSRSEAKRRLQFSEFEKDMEGILSDSVCKSTIDEAPQVYKNPEEIERLIEPTAEVIDRLKVIRNFKDKSNDEREN